MGCGLLLRFGGFRVAIDLVYSAAVDYVDSASAKAVTKAAGGTVTVMIDNDSPIIIQTKDIKFTVL